MLDRADDVMELSGMCLIIGCQDNGKPVRMNHVHKCGVENCKYNGLVMEKGHEHIIGSEGGNSYRIPLAVRYDLIPPIFLKELAEIYEEGAQKYGECKYIEKPLPFSSIINHMLNHLMLYASGDRSEKHMAKVAWGAATMINLEQLAKEGFIDSTYDLTAFGARVSEAIQKRKDSGQ